MAQRGSFDGSLEGAFDGPFDDSDAAQELLAGYVLGDLSPDEEVQVVRQLTAQPALAEDVAALQTTLALVALATPAVEPPVGLRDRLLAQVAQPPTGVPNLSEAPTQLEQPDRPRPYATASRKRFPVLWGTVGSVAAVLVAGLGISNYQLQREVAALRAEFREYQETVAMLQQPNNRMLSLQPMVETMPSSGSLVIAPSSNQAMLTLQNLDMPPEGMVYRMWAFVDGQKIDCADFWPDESGQVVLQIPVESWSNATAVVINIEPADRVAPEEGTMVLMGGTL